MRKVFVKAIGLIALVVCCLGSSCSETNPEMVQAAREDFERRTSKLGVPPETVSCNEGNALAIIYCRGVTPKGATIRAEYTSDGEFVRLEAD